MRCRLWLKILYNGYQMRKDNFVTGEYYHIYNRTISNYRVFNDERNAKYLMKAFLFANSTKSSEAFKHLRNNKPKATSDVALGFNEALEIIKQEIGRASCRVR